MRRDGIEQWDEIYPTEKGLLSDIESGSLFVAAFDDAIAGLVVLNEFQDPEYAGVPWTIDGGRIAVVHRLMVDPLCQGRGVASELMLFVERRAREQGYHAVRLDAFTQNPAALRLYQGLGYHDAGAMRLRKGWFRGFEKALSHLL